MRCFLPFFLLFAAATLTVSLQTNGTRQAHGADSRRNEHVISGEDGIQGPQHQEVGRLPGGLASAALGNGQRRLNTRHSPHETQLNLLGFTQVGRV